MDCCRYIYIYTCMLFFVVWRTKRGHKCEYIYIHIYYIHARIHMYIYRYIYICVCDPIHKCLANILYIQMSQTPVFRRRIVISLSVIPAFSRDLPSNLLPPTISIFVFPKRNHILISLRQHSNEVNNQKITQKKRKCYTIHKTSQFLPSIQESIHQETTTSPLRMWLRASCWGGGFFSRWYLEFRYCSWKSRRMFLNCKA